MRTESSEHGREFGVKSAQHTTLEEQALWAIGSIKKNEERWQKFVLDKFKIEYKHFFVYYAGEGQRGWHTGEPRELKKYIQTLTKALHEVEEEFNESSGDVGVGTEDRTGEGAREEKAPR